MEILKATPELLAAYVNFLVEFSRTPVETLKSITAGTEGAEPQVSGKLFLYLLLSVGVGIVINYIGAAAEMAPDNSRIVRLLGRMDEKFLPVAVLIAIVIFAVVSHVVLIAAGFVQALLGEERPKGSIAGAINGFTGFAALGLPLIMVGLVTIRIAAAHTSVNPLIFLAIIILPMSLALLVYFIAALAAGYGITLVRAWLLVGMAVVLISLVAELF